MSLRIIEVYSGKRRVMGLLYTSIFIADEFDDNIWQTGRYSANGNLSRYVSRVMEHPVTSNYSHAKKLYNLVCQLDFEYV